MLIIDSHMHCGVQNVSQPYSDLESLLVPAGIERACLYPPVEDIYYRYETTFDDNEKWRQCRRRAHDYLLALATEKPVYPYYFVWNDFLLEELEKPFGGIKWHHHAGEPEYRYDAPRCEAMIDRICEKQFPVVLEETFQTTLDFLSRINKRTVVIIPHLGLLNGGFGALMEAGVWESEMVWADTALAGEREIRGFIDRYGADRLVFGSDYPFGLPGPQLTALRRMNLPEPELEKILSGNILRVLRRPDDAGA